MTDQDPGTEGSERYGGDRRGRDRRKSERRGDGRRAPPPPWRRPAAFIAYGVFGALVLLLALRGLGGEGEPVAAVTEDPAGAAATAPEANLPAAGSARRTALTVADFERLVAEGDAAVGSVVEAELYCGSIARISLMESVEVDPRLLALADSEGRVPGAECRWSENARSSDFLLVVPSQHAEAFAQAPEVELNFVRHRRVPVELIWLGRSEALALRTAGILSQIRTVSR